MSEEGATGGGADEAMAVDSGFESSSVTSPGSTVSGFSDQPSESGSGSNTISGSSVHSTLTVNPPGHQESHGNSEQHSVQSHGTFGHGHPGQFQRPGQTTTFPGSSVHSTLTVNAPGHQESHGNSEQHSVQSHGTSGHGHPGHSQRPGQTMTFPGQHVDQPIVNSSISSGRTPGSASNPSLSSEKKYTTDRKEQSVEKSFEVFVKNLDGKTYTIEANLDEEVTTFRRKVCQRLGIPGEQQRLTLQEGRNLEDGRRLRDYPGFKKHCNIYCQGRLRGGQGF